MLFLVWYNLQIGCLKLKVLNYFLVPFRGQSPKGGVEMNKYELTVIVKPTLDEDSIKKEFESVQEIITKFGGVIEKVDDWGKRRLAYEIKKFNEGFYNFITFTAENETPAEIENRMRIKENIIRYLIVRQDV